MEPASSSTSEPKAESTSEPTKKDKQLVRFFIISDTHDGDTPTPSDFQPPTNLPKIDVVLHCGDLTVNGTLSSLRRAIDKLASIPADLRLAIAGNHEITLDPEYYASQTTGANNHESHHENNTKNDSDAALSLLTTYASTVGVTYLPEGTHTLTLPTGTPLRVHASPWTPRHGLSAFQYPTGTDRFNPPATTPPWATNTATATSLIPSVSEGGSSEGEADHAIDVLLTHGPPQYILDTTPDNRSAGCEHLRRAVGRARPRLHAFGHVHGGWGVQRVVYGEEEDGDGGVEALPREWVGVNGARRRGWAGLPGGCAEKVRRGEGGVMVNAAVEGDGGGVGWVVELEL